MGDLAMRPNHMQLPLHRHSVSLAAMAGLSLAVLSSPIHAGSRDGCVRVIQDLQFPAEGALPSACGWEFFTNTGHTESSMYAVVDGALEQRTIDVEGNASYAYPRFDSENGDLRPDVRMIMEARITIHDIDGGTGLYMQAFDGGHRYTVQWWGGGFSDCDAPACAVVNTSDGHRTFPIELGQHTFRFESPPDSGDFEFLIDDVLVFSSSEDGTTAPSEDRFNLVSFGDGATPSGNGADADWDFVRIWQVTEELLEGDANCDQLVDFEDILIILGAWGPCPETPCRTDCPGDLNGDRSVNFADILLVLAGWTG